MTKEREDFGIEMAKSGVKPLKKRQEKVALRTTKMNLNLPVLRAAASADVLHANDPSHYSAIEWLGPHDIVEYKTHGVQHDQFKKLKQGRNEISADLDLHSFRVEEARVALFRFIQDCLAHDIRCVIIIHGKGWHGQQDTEERVSASQEKGQSRIKSYTVHWLKSMESVLAFSSAQARDGGTGALYVLLRKAKME